MTSKHTIEQIKNAIRPFIDAGLIPQNEFSEFLKLARQDSKPKEETKKPTSLSRKEVAEMLGISLRGVDRLAENGDLKPRKVGKRRVVFRLVDVIAYLENA